MPFGNDHADHIYVSGRGFVSGRDPLRFVERDLRRISAASGFCLVLLLALPSVILWPVEIFTSFNTTVLSLFFGSSALTSANELLRETRELTVGLLSWGFVYLLLKGMLQPPKQTPSSTIGSRRALLCALLITGGMTALTVFGTSLLHRITGFLHLLELNPGTPVPDRPLAVFVYLIRAILLPAVFEELLFRKCILQSARRHGDSFALFFSAFCGGLVHFTLSGDLFGFVMGLVFGYFYLRTGSLRTVISCHALSLAFPLVLDALQGLIQSPLYTAARYLMLILLAAAGLAGFVLFCRWNHNAFILDDSRGGGLSFRRKLQICLTGTPMLLAMVLWLAQVVRNLQVIL